MAQQLQKYFGLSVHVQRIIDPHNYTEFIKAFQRWLKEHPEIERQAPQLYVHRLQFVVEPRHFTIAGIENRVGSLEISVEINPKVREKGSMKFINNKVGHRLSPMVQHSFGEYKNTYTLEGRQLRDQTHFEEYLATVVLKRVSEEDRKVKFIVAADAIPAYGSQVLKNVDMPAVTKTDFRLNRDVQLAFHFGPQPQ